MKPGRPKGMKFPIRRTEVVYGRDLIRTVEEGSAVNCVLCGMPFKIDQTTTYYSRDEQDSQIEMVRCPHCGRRACIYHYYDQTEKLRKRPNYRRDGDVYIIQPADF